MSLDTTSARLALFLAAQQRVNNDAARLEKAENYTRRLRLRLRVSAHELEDAQRALERLDPSTPVQVLSTALDEQHDDAELEAIYPGADDVDHLDAGVSSQVALPDDVFAEIEPTKLGEPLPPATGTRENFIRRRQRLHAEKGARSRELLTHQEVGALMAACGETPAGVRNRALIAVLAATGVRIAEALGIAAGDLDMDARRLRVGKVTEGKQRDVWVHGDAVAPMRAWADVRNNLGLEDAPLFCSLSGKTLNTSYVRRTFPKLATAVRIYKHVHAEAFRPVFVDNAKAKLSLRQLQSQLGHESVAATCSYLERIGAHPEEFGEVDAPKIEAGAEDPDPPSRPLHQTLSPTVRPPAKAPGSKLLPPYMRDVLGAMPSAGAISFAALNMRLPELAESALRARLTKAKRWGLIESAGWGQYALTDDAKPVRRGHLHVVK